MRSISDAMTEAWVSSARRGDKGVSRFFQGTQIDCIALCHSTAVHRDGAVLYPAKECIKIQNAAVYSVAFKSYSMLDRVIHVQGRSDPPLLHFEGRPDDPCRFDKECFVPPKLTGHGPICGEIFVPIIPSDYEIESPVTVTSEVTVVRRPEFVHLNEHVSIVL